MLDQFLPQFLSCVGQRTLNLTLVLSTLAKNSAKI